MEGLIKMKKVVYDILYSYLRIKTPFVIDPGYRPLYIKDYVGFGGKSPVVAMLRLRATRMGPPGFVNWLSRRAELEYSYGARTNERRWLIE